MKFLKKGLKIIIKNPRVLVDENSRNIKFHFDLMHGENNLYRAINLLDDENNLNPVVDLYQIQLGMNRDFFLELDTLTMHHFQTILLIQLFYKVHLPEE